MLNSLYDPNLNAMHLTLAYHHSFQNLSQVQNCLCFVSVQKWFFPTSQEMCISPFLITPFSFHTLAIRFQSQTPILCEFGVEWGGKSLCHSGGCQLRWCIRIILSALLLSTFLSITHNNRCILQDGPFFLIIRQILLIFKPV